MMGKKMSPRTKKIAAIIAASLVGISVVNAAAVIVMHDAFFPRYERPDYAIYPGLYHYERVRDSLKREELSFISSGERLQAYYYPTEHSQGLIVFAHGFHSGADDYLFMIEPLTKAGYSVFTYDAYGTYSSGGDSLIGMCQSVRDIDSALNYVKSSPRFSSLPVFLLGYSLGGYAVTSVLELHPWVKACAAIAPLNSASRIMIEKSEQYAGKIVYASKPVLDAYLKYLFGDLVDCSGVRGINSVSIPIFIAHGVEDTTVTYGKQSIISHKDEITNPNVSYYSTTGHAASHTGILHSEASWIYRSGLEAEYARLEGSLDRELTYEEKCEFYSKVDHRLYSEPNVELLNMIVDTYKKAEK